LAAYFNPAAMAFLPTSVHLGAQLLVAGRCFTRLGANGKPVSPDTSIPAPVLGTPATQPDGSTPPSDTVCSKFSPFPIPQLGAVFRVADRVALGLAIITPHSAGAASWPESLPYTNTIGFATTQPSPQRYLLVSSSALILFPTVSVAYAPLENLSFGAGLIWGIGTVDFVTFSETLSPPPAAGMVPTDHSVNDAKAELKAKDLFIPGVVLSALWMATPYLDVSAWFKWQDALKANADLTLTSEYWRSSGVREPSNDTKCMMAGQPAGCNITNAPSAGAINFQIPMEAKLGLRFHWLRKDPGPMPGWLSASNLAGRKVRDPMSQDLFDVELDFTWAHNSAVQDLGLTFHSLPPMASDAGGATNICLKNSGGCIGAVPVNGNIPHRWKEVVGVRLGGDYVPLPNRLAVRAGTFLETSGQDAQYLNLDFDLAQKVGLSIGATGRVGPVDISVGYAHTFYGTLDNGGNGQVFALSGDTTGLSSGRCGTPVSNPTPVVGGCLRSYQSVNGGRLTSSLDEIGVAATARF
jgi:long-chain fatty acid transport protein